jgi:hypothetical protein
MNTNLVSLEKLAYSLKYSGFIINIGIKEYSGEGWLKTNYNISEELFDSFVEKAKDLNIIEKINMSFKYKTENINDILYYWIGNKEIVEYIEYDIKEILNEKKQDLYLCNIISKTYLLSEYNDIFDSIAMAGLIFIFKSEKNITSIALQWAS